MQLDYKCLKIVRIISEILVIIFCIKIYFPNFDYLHAFFPSSKEKKNQSTTWDIKHKIWNAHLVQYADM